jgi:hypothetical protein
MNRSRKSQVDEVFFVGLLRNILADAYMSFPEIPRHELDKDIAVLESRVEHEGFEFLSVALPKLGKAIDRALETGRLIVPSGFARKAKSGVRYHIPAFMSALFATVFRPVDGSLVPRQLGALALIRQVCFVAYKVETPPKPSHVATTLEKFRDVDASLPRLTAKMKRSPITQMAREFIGRVLAGIDPRDIRPRHGPGAVADRLKGRDKWTQVRFSPSINRLYPYREYILGEGDFGNHGRSFSPCDLPWGNPPPARVCIVPKDSRGPRIISCEPAILQYLQQGLANVIVDRLHSHPSTRGHVNFDDQTVNQRLAILGSKIPSFATLDMKDASDRVSLELVETLFPEWLLPYLRVTRSTATELPDGSVVVMNKFAPMGSALCFPVESLVFFALATAVVGYKNRRQRCVTDSVFVFGDDLVTLNDDAADVIRVLELYGLRFNTEKCFVQGNFRESCGVDSYLGRDVTPIKVRVPVKRGRQRLTDLYRLSAEARGFFDSGFWRTANYLWNWVESTVGPLPTAHPAFAGPCRTSNLLPPVFYSNGAKTRWNERLQRFEVRTFWLDCRKVSSPFPSTSVRLLHNLIRGVARPYDDDVVVSGTPTQPKSAWAGI